MSGYLDFLVRRYPVLETVKDSILKTYNIIENSFSNDGTLFLCGNGGSASDCEHVAGELLKSFTMPRPVDHKVRKNLEDRYGDDGTAIAKNLQSGLKTISLTSHSAYSTAFSNDVDASLVFAQQLYVLGKENDVLLAFSTSGNSENILKCIQVASAMNIKTILMTGADGGRCAEEVTCSVKVPEKETFMVQELHLPVYHALCLMLEERFYGK